VSESKEDVPNKQQQKKHHPRINGCTTNDVGERKSPPPKTGERDGISLMLFFYAYILNKKSCYPL